MAAGSKAVIRSFVEEVLNQGQLDRMNDLAALILLDPIRGQKRLQKPYYGICYGNS